ncbi:phosphatidylinositol transfer protein beta isoform-like [Convolutriloba macropyga]|uniref:phosphatidylinositol transfer protein beta isoform-like n=1 Tax=Convolutriloba macropyga TaxID=536237 RepID=UPI003F51FB1E
MNEEHRLFNRLHKQLFCWMDQWYGLTMEDIRRLEQQVAIELADELNKGEPKGYKPQEGKPKK